MTTQISYLIDSVTRWLCFLGTWQGWKLALPPKSVLWWLRSLTWSPEPLWAGAPRFLVVHSAQNFLLDSFALSNGPLQDLVSLGQHLCLGPTSDLALKKKVTSQTHTQTSVPSHGVLSNDRKHISKALSGLISVPLTRVGFRRKHHLPLPHRWAKELNPKTALSQGIFSLLFKTELWKCSPVNFPLNPVSLQISPTKFPL